MSTDPTQPPAGHSLRDFWARHRAVLVPLVVSLVSALVGSVLTYLGVPPAVVEVIKEAPATVIQGGEPTEYSPTQGWHRDADVIASNLDPSKTPQFDATPAGRVSLGDEDVFLWQAVRKVNNRGPPWYPSVNQQSVGCCVGCAYKHCADVSQATAIASGAAFQWKPVSVEVIYGGSRVEVGGGRISGDGSVGAWAAKWVKDYGVVPMAKYDAVDLTTFSPARAREFGRTGVHASIESLAKEHPVKGTALVKSWADVKRAVQQGYPVAVCSDQGFTMSRDSTGRARPQGTWSHAMSIIAVRAAKDGRAEGGFVLNSWGDQAHTGPVWPADAPVAGFWADANVIDRMVRQGDSFALSGVQGFPARALDWFVRSDAREHASSRLSDIKQKSVLVYALAP